jgi:hypothetical protein
MRYLKWAMAALLSATVLAGCQKYGHNVMGYNLTQEAAEGLERYKTTRKESRKDGMKRGLPPESDVLKKASEDIFVDGTEMEMSILRTLLHAAGFYSPGGEIKPPLLF